MYAAYLARAHLAAAAGDDDVRTTAGPTGPRHLRAAFNEHFWLPDRGWFALGLDGDKRPIDALASNMGHCLWSGIIDEDKAAAGRRAPDVAGDVHRLGRAHPRHRRWAPTTR